MAHGLGMPMLGSALNEWRCYFEFLERSQMVSRNPKTFTLRKDKFMGLRMYLKLLKSVLWECYRNLI